MNNGYPGFYSQGVMCDIFDENTVYYVAKKASVARSRDGGKTWEEVIPDNSNFAAYQKILAQDAAGNLYASVPSGIFKLDRATDKVTCLYDKFKEATGNKGIYFMDIEVSADGQHIYAAANINSKDESATPGIYASHDGGATWEIKGSDDTRTFACRTIALHPADPMRVFAGGQFTDKATGKAIKDYMLYETTDGGNTFTDKFLVTYENLEEGVSKTPKTFYHLTFGPKNENGIYPLYLAGQQMTYNYLVSYDYGTSFERLITPENSKITKENEGPRYPAGHKGYTGWWCQPFALDMTKPGRVILSYLGPAEYYNGKIRTMSSGFSGASVSDIALDSQLRPFFVTIDVKGFLHESGSMKAGDTLTMNAMHFDEGDSAGTKALTFTKAVFDPNDDNHVIAYVGTNNADPTFDGVRQSFDRGATWQAMNPETAQETAPYGTSTILRYDAEDTNTIYTSYHTSHDNGKTWESNSMTVFAMTEDCKKWLGVTGTNKETQLHLSYDKGKTWTYAISPGFSNDIKGIFFDTVDSNYLWIVRGLYVQRFNLTTGEVENLTSKFEYPYFNRAFYNPEIPGHMIFLSSPGSGMNDSDFKIIETRDNGKTWQIVPGGWGGYFNNVEFIEGKAYIGGHQGLFEYDYKKYWEFLESKITVLMDDREISFSVMPEIIEGRTMVPMRELFEMLGATLNWDGETRTVTAHKGTNSVKLQIDNLTVNMNGEEKQMEAAPYIKNSRTMVPLRFASEALGIRVGWDNASRTIYLIS